MSLVTLQCQHRSEGQAPHLGPLLLNDVDDVVCEISLNDYFIFCCDGRTTREFLREESLSLFQLDVCKSQHSTEV